MVGAGPGREGGEGHTSIRARVSEAVMVWGAWPIVPLTMYLLILVLAVLDGGHVERRFVWEEESAWILQGTGGRAM